MPFPLVGLKGHATAGKDASGKLLVEEYGFTRVAFCDGIGAVARGLGWDGNKANGGREFLQDVGGAVRGALGEEAFVIPTLRQILELLDQDHPVVVTDVRMVTEFNAIQACGGIVAEVRRPGVGIYNDNATEVSLLDAVADFVIDNDGDLDVLRNRVDDLLSVEPPTGRAVNCREAASRTRSHITRLALGDHR